ncbi:MAG: hypothetical protein ACR2PA_13190 [Hyphomicrobiaceae bacterium]
MIAHVAEAGEARGRVVLRFCSGRPHEMAVRAAFQIAQAFQSEIESLFIEDAQLIDLARFEFATEISLTGRHRRRLSQRSVHQSFRASFEAARRMVEQEAQAAEVPMQHSFVRDEPVHALAAACAQRGPWNVVALAEAFGTTSCATLRELFSTVPDTTGVILAGPRTRRVDGPVIIAVEEIDRFPGMLRAAEKLAALSESDIVALIVADNQDRFFQLDGEVRLILGDREDVTIVPSAVAHGEAAVIAESIRKLRGGFLIAQFGSLVVPESGGLRPLTSALECPLFLVR